MPARAIAQITTDFHDEPSIRSLTVEQQWAYELLLKRPDLSRCGVVAYTPRRWAKFAKGMTEKKLRGIYENVLSSTRHIVLDDDTEEVFARTYVRHDGLLKQPNVVAAMVGDYRLISSPTIKTAFLVEMRRIWDLDLADGARGGWQLAMGTYPPETNDKDVRFPDGMKPAALAALRKAIGPGLAPEMREAIDEGSVKPFEQGSEKGSPQGFTEGSRARVGVAPSPSPYAESDADAVAASTPAAAGSGRGPQDLLDQNQADHGPLPTITATALTEHLNQAITDGTPDNVLLDALAEWRRRPKAKPGLLPHLIGDQVLHHHANPTNPLDDPDAQAWIAAEQARIAANGSPR